MPTQHFTGDHQAAMAGKTQGAWQLDEGDGVLDLILGALCAQSFFTLKGEAFESEEGDTVSDSSRCTDSEGTATASVSWSMKRERLKTSVLAQLQELVRQERQFAVESAMMVTKEKHQASTLLNLPPACFIHGPAEFQLAPIDSSCAVYDSRYRLAANQGVLVVGVAA
ncbi:hypothetical protein ARMGADRAFT_1029673 [Armillaria gallica]|uniref:Uncharacterized protein n=1 Tax=Armillaria gallica TaxID=47427 RepID=A0A2H3DEZ5_ARMGA|nr:hypothetical protein ARMGADRAFT_1029673 [Armillaria gallica]